MKQKQKTEPAKEPLNLSALARQHGLSREALRQWRDSGLDIADPAALRAKIATSRSPAAINAAATSGGETLASAKLRRERALADKAELEVARRRGDLLELDLVAQAFSALGAVFRQTLVRVPGELPDMLEGLDPPAMQRRLQDYVTKLFSDLEANIESQFSNIKHL